MSIYIGSSSSYPSRAARFNHLLSKQINAHTLELIFSPSIPQYCLFTFRSFLDKTHWVMTPVLCAVSQYVLMAEYVWQTDGRITKMTRTKATESTKCPHLNQKRLWYATSTTYVEEACCNSSRSWHTWFQRFSPQLPSARTKWVALSWAHSYLYMHAQQVRLEMTEQRPAIQLKGEYKE